ncbi:MAG: transcriptional regulator, TetR family, partial [Phenylobacterium sp.]|nr:transcriptional regulator, TetR family [Phenylobacterium sp.]
VADFRERLCAAAERLFAAKGLDGVTMRQLAAELGVSPMTPYRYFRDKNEILAAVRAAGYQRFAEILERVRDTDRSPRARGAAAAEAYIRFAFENPDTYKLMFDFDQPDEEAYPALVAATRRAGAQMSGWVEDLVASGDLAGDPVQIGRMFWAAAHGAVVLEMAGRLPKGGARELHQAMASALARGLRPV